ncbi:MAG TPA: nucleotide disphospho-sugar-binding domain-containing protein [Actinophytocola sp.]|nr:nucleotide disphospho-sugar-binding domain-containing protein [Actinophytocola sp.]
MRISLPTYGSRGDVQPFVTLGACLRSRGHDVELAAPAEFAALAEQAGLGFRALPGNPSAALHRPEVVAAIRKGPSATRIGIAARKSGQSEEDDPVLVLGAMREAIEGADLVVANWMTKMACLIGPEVPWCTLSTWARVPTRKFPAVGWPELPLGGRYNLLSHKVWNALEWLPTRPVINRMRAAKDQPPLDKASPFRDTGRERPVLLPFSTEVLPRPADWPAAAHLTGFLFMDRDRPVDPALADFVGTGAKPIVLTVGNLWHIYPEQEVVDTVVATARRAGRRVVLIGGGEEHADDDVFRATEVDYRWLLSRSAAFVHHGGFGTTAEAVRAGVPQVVMPSFSDHPYMANLVHRAGVAVRPVPLTKLTERTLREALDACLNDAALAERARAVGARVAAEDGVGTAVKVIENWAAK